MEVMTNAAAFQEEGPGMNEPFVQRPERSYVELPVTLVIELTALNLLRAHAVQQNIPLEQLLVQYIGRCGKAVEQGRNEGILAECFDPMIRRNGPSVPSRHCGTCGLVSQVPTGGAAWKQ